MRSRNGEAVIVDEFTGRLMPGRRYSEGLLQAIEVKEGVKVQRESDNFSHLILSKNPSSPCCWLVGDW